MRSVYGDANGNRWITPPKDSDQHGQVARSSYSTIDEMASNKNFVRFTADWFPNLNNLVPSLLGLAAGRPTETLPIGKRTVKTKIESLFRKNGKSKEALSPGTAAPDFSLAASTGETLSLSDFRGRPVVLVFYPADESSVCTSQLALYNEAEHLFDEHDAQLLGISVDGVASHQAFAESLNLSFPLLADDEPTGEVAGRYGVFNSDDGVSERALFVVDPEGVIRWSHVSPRGVNPGANGILDALESMEQAAPRGG
jgi:peroxiredoxin